MNRLFIQPVFETRARSFRAGESGQGIAPGLGGNGADHVHLRGLAQQGCEMLNIAASLPNAPPPDT